MSFSHLNVSRPPDTACMAHQKVLQALPGLKCQTVSVRFSEPVHALGGACLQSVKFGDLYKYFPDAIVLGTSDKETGKSVLNPNPETIIGPDDNLILMRPSSIPNADYMPLKQPMHVQLGKP